MGQDVPLTALSDKEKSKIIKYIKKGCQRNTIAKKFNVSVRNLRVLLNHFHMHGNVDVLPRFNIKVKKKIAAILDENPHTSIRDLGTLLVDEGFPSFGYTCLRESKKIYKRYGVNWFEMTNTSSGRMTPAVCEVISRHYCGIGFEVIFQIWDELIESGICCYSTLPGSSVIRKRLR